MDISKIINMNFKDLDYLSMLISKHVYNKLIKKNEMVGYSARNMRILFA